MSRPTPQALAEYLGLKTANEIMPLARRKKSTAIEKQADELLDVHKVSIVGHLDRVFRFAGDNDGGQAVRVIMSSDLDGDSADAIDRHQPHHEMGELVSIYCQTKRRGLLLKTALENVLMGHTDKARHSWRDLPEGVDTGYLGLLIGQAVDDSDVPVFDFSGWQERRDALIGKLTRKARKAG